MNGVTNGLFYMKLALQNIKKNAQTYVPYILTCIGSVMMFDIILTLADNKEIAAMHGGSDMRTILGLGCYIIALFTAVFLFYTNSFLMKRRKKEIGLFNILGMGKKHIGFILFFETAIIGAVSLGAGITGGFVLSKAVHLLLLRLAQAPVQWGLYFSGKAALMSVLLYGTVFLLILAGNLARVHVSSPVELLRGGQEGEREPKTRWWIAIIGTAALGGGYYLAVTTSNPAYAISAFFYAAILVMIGTYCLFTAGSIALLKLLKKKKGFYYRTEHFISVSGLLYRMKQNAAGLAGICILSTSVLVMLSSTVALYVGMDDVTRNRYPRNILLEAVHASPADEAVIAGAVQEVLSANGLGEENHLSYSDLSLLAVEEKPGVFDIKTTYTTADLEKIQPMYVMTQEDYGRVTGNQAKLSEGQCMVVTQYSPYEEDSLTVLGRTYQAVPAGDYRLWDGADTFGSEVYYLIVPDDEEMQLLEAGQQAGEGGRVSSIRYHYGFDLDTDQDTQIRIYNEIMHKASVIPEGIQGESAAEGRASYFSLNAGLLFLGIFLGTLFVMATVLIIYYKQVTEGYEDKSRFGIMQKVGLTRAEIKGSIHSQMLLMFFLPLAAAAMHITAAFPIITKLLAAMNLTNVRLFAAATAGTLAVFAVVYTAVYMLTSRVYLRIVSS